MNAVATAQPLHGIKLFASAGAVSMAYFLVILDITIANVSVPHIAGTLGASATQGTWVITTYAVAEAICLPLTAWLARRFGTLRTYVWGLTGFTIASGLCGMATSMEALLVFRALQGACGAPLLPLCQTLLIRIFPSEKASMAIAASAMTAVIAPIAGPVVGGAITDNWSWRWIFFINLPFAIVCILAVSRMLRDFETPRIIERIDFFGLLLLIVWVGSLQLMLDLGRDRDWFDSTLIVSLAIVAGVGFVTFLIWEFTEEAPIVNLHVLRHRGYWTSVVGLSVAYAVLMSGNVLLPLWAQVTMGYTATMAGYILAPVSLFSLICVPLSGYFAKRVDPRFLIYAGLSWLGLVTIMKGFATTDLDTVSIAFPQLLQGLSTAFYMLGLTVIALSSVPANELAAAAGLMAFLRTMATAACISWTTTHWDSQTQVVRATLAAQMNGGEETIATMMRNGLSEIQARISIERLVEAQSATISYDNICTTLGILCLLVAQFVWMIPRPRKPAAVK